MERVYRFPAAAFLDTFCPDEFADTTPDPNHRVQPPLHRPKHPKAARDFDEVDIGGSDELWDYSFAEAFNASAMCPEHTLVMGHDEEDVFGALYDDGDDVPENDTNVQWGLIQACFLFFEQDDDPFAPEDSISHLSDAFTRRHRKHQLYVSTFVARVLSRQQHTHLFLLVISGASARIVRADREAFFATHTFSYKTAPERSVLRDFFRRFTNMGRAGRGIDTTALLLREGLLGSTGERIGFMREMADHELDGAADHARTCDKKSLDEDWPWYSVTVEGLEFLIAKPSAYSDKPSRPSRGYIGLCFSAGPRHGTFVWLKDTWRRILDNEYEQEGAVLSDLNRLGVQNVPTLVCHGDVSNHRLNLKETLVRLHKQKPKHVRSRVERVHYRVVTEEVGLPIEDFGNGRELAVLFRDCLQAHRNACERARILHRDISEGNLLMVPYDTQFDDGVGIAYKGMLIDWEYSERISKRSAPDFIYRVDRRGTWDFLSVNATNHPERPVQPVDDFESFFHVFVALGLSFLRHNCERPTQFEADYFSTRTTSGGPWASALKERCVKHGRLSLVSRGRRVCSSSKRRGGNYPVAGSWRRSWCHTPSAGFSTRGSR
ncbi:hypothetical protein C8T65DRAFT_126514 [Cerioporus squamosus]|nr:hypothetical protein C8T65DRAFT_126514 [Cerioporus squamosus]